MRLGVFGGTFDPIHIGHLAIAERARVALGLDRVLFMPAGLPPHKLDQALGAPADRLEMVRRAIAGHQGFAVSEIELQRAGPSYTVDTLEALAAAWPGVEIFYLLGSDSVVELLTWQDPPRLFQAATFAALLRPGTPRAQLDAWLAALPAAARPRLVVVDVPALDIASRALRAEVAAGGSIRYLVSDPVLAYIHDRGLYRQGRPEAAVPPPAAATVRQALAERLSPARAAHCERVAATAVRLAHLHGLDADAAELAGLLHDWYREAPVAEILDLAAKAGVIEVGTERAAVVVAALHGPVAARLLPARWPGLSQAVLTAIDRHTTGAPGMSAFDCLIYVADLVEPGHHFEGLAELTALAERDLARAALAGLEATMTRLLATGRAIDPRTVLARNALRQAGGGTPATPAV